MLHSNLHIHSGSEKTQQQESDYCIEIVQEGSATSNARSPSVEIGKCAQVINSGRGRPFQFDAIALDAVPQLARTSVANLLTLRGLIIDRTPNGNLTSKINHVISSLPGSILLVTGAANTGKHVMCERIVEYAAEELLRFVGSCRPNLAAGEEMYLSVSAVSLYHKIGIVDVLDKQGPQNDLFEGLRKLQEIKAAHPNTPCERAFLKPVEIEISNIENIRDVLTRERSGLPCFQGTTVAEAANHQLTSHAIFSLSVTFEKRTRALVHIVRLASEDCATPGNRVGNELLSIKDTLCVRNIAIVRAALAAKNLLPRKSDDEFGNIFSSFRLGKAIKGMCALHETSRDSSDSTDLAALRRQLHLSSRHSRLTRYLSEELLVGLDLFTFSPKQHSTISLELPAPPTTISILSCVRSSVSQHRHTLATCMWAQEIVSSLRAAEKELLGRSDSASLLLRHRQLLCGNAEIEVQTDELPEDPVHQAMRESTRILKKAAQATVKNHKIDITSTTLNESDLVVPHDNSQTPSTFSRETQYRFHDPTAILATGSANTSASIHETFDTSPNSQLHQCSKDDFELQDSADESPTTNQGFFMPRNAVLGTGLPPAEIAFEIQPRVVSALPIEQRRGLPPKIWKRDASGVDSDPDKDPPHCTSNHRTSPVLAHYCPDGQKVLLVRTTPEKGEQVPQGFSQKQETDISGTQNSIPAAALYGFVVPKIEPENTNSAHEYSPSRLANFLQEQNQVLLSDISILRSRLADAADKAASSSHALVQACQDKAVAEKEANRLKLCLSESASAVADLRSLYEKTSLETEHWKNLCAVKEGVETSLRQRVRALELDIDNLRGELNDMSVAHTAQHEYHQKRLKEINAATIAAEDQRLTALHQSLERERQARQKAEMREMQLHMEVVELRAAVGKFEEDALPVVSELISGIIFSGKKKSRQAKNDKKSME